MPASELKHKLIVGDGASEQISAHFSKNILSFHKNHTTIRELLYKTETGLLFLPALEDSSHVLTQRIRRDRYLELLPIVYYSDETLSDKDWAVSIALGVNDFIAFSEPNVEVVKKRILSMANLYWKLKKENAQDENKSDLTRSVEFLDSLIEHLPNMVFVKDAKELRFVRFNRAGEKLLGYGRESLIGKNDYDFFPKEQADNFTLKDRAVISSGQLLDIPEEPIHTKEGLRILHTRKIPLYDERGNPSYLLGISEDITEIKKADHERMQLVKEQAARVEAEKGIQVRDDFISIASHELKTPLTSLDLQFQIIKRWFNKKEYSETAFTKLQKVFEDSILQLDKISNLIEDLLDVSRVQRGKFDFNFEKNDVAVLVRDTLSRLASQLKSMGCELKWGKVEQAFCNCDAFRIDQALSNLISNSMKYGQGKEIEVSVIKVHDNVEISVKDYGVGIAPENQKKIFERFERAVSFKNISGLGLGLYITKEIIEAHGGMIEVESTLGHGALFKVFLPLHSESSEKLT